MKGTVPVICGAILVAVLAEHSATSQQKATPTVYSVTGSGWQSCGDWNRYQHDFKSGYVIGRLEASAQISNILGDIPAARQVKESFQWPAGLSTGDYEKSLDKFCGDPYNARIALANAFGFVNATLVGNPPFDDKFLVQLRCMGAAGADKDRIRDCIKN
jgi:hypothetical protein